MSSTRSSPIRPSARAVGLVIAASLAASCASTSHLASSPDRPATTAPASATTPALTTAAPVKVVGTVSHGTITFGGLQRTYRLYVPKVLPASPVPLFIGLHGGGGWGDQFAQTNHIEQLAETNGFIVVHPDGVKIATGQGGVWNGGDCYARAVRENIDDVGFVNALIDQLTSAYEIDPHRVYAFGHSNGAIMSYRLACEDADRIAGIGLFAGTLGLPSCTPSKPVSVLHIHGTADMNIPITGGTGSESTVAVDFAPPHDGFNTLASADGCTVSSTTTAGDITTESKTGCNAGSAATFVTIAGANHAWAGGTPIVTPSVGPAYANYDATAAIAAFLLAHPRP